MFKNFFKLNLTNMDLDKIPHLSIFIILSLR